MAENRGGVSNCLVPLEELYCKLMLPISQSDEGLQCKETGLTM